MKKQQSTRTAEAASATTRNPSVFLQLAEMRAHRKVRIALPSLPHHRLCLVNRAVIAAAELAFWQATGGDVLVPLHIMESNSTSKER
jgi:hypothetical protein